VFKFLVSPTQNKLSPVLQPNIINLPNTNPTMARRSSTSSTSSARRGNTTDDENDNRRSRAPERKSPDRTAGNPANFRNRSREEVSEIGRKGGHNSRRGVPGQAGTG